MRIILSPAKKMRVDDDIQPSGMPVFLEQSEIILDWLRQRDQKELKKLWACSDKIMQENMERLETMDLKKAVTPALYAYDGIAYQYLAPEAFSDDEIAYVQNNLRILSAFYGVLKPMDAVTPYRLEMQAKASIGNSADLYDFWKDSLYEEVQDDSHVFINLASKEYSRCIESYLQPGDRYITCIFGQMEKGKVVQKGVYAKMARGDMVCWMAQNEIEDPEDLKGYDRLHFRYEEALSSHDTYVFLKD
ncbi:MAG: peroxide stress protein YaaA [Bulleidia sp.]|nr:peroxide stress protein YaaA [Bulleidia sp.]